MEGRARLRQRCTERKRPAPAVHRDHLWERSVSLFALRFGRSPMARARNGDIGPRWHAHVGGACDGAAAVHPAADRQRGVCVAAGDVPPLAAGFLGRGRLRADAVDRACSTSSSASTLFSACSLAPISGYAAGWMREVPGAARRSVCRAGALAARRGLVPRHVPRGDGKDYVRAPRAKGLAEVVVMFRPCCATRSSRSSPAPAAYLPYVFPAAWCSRASSASGPGLRDRRH